jgi:hypothetical protein
MSCDLGKVAKKSLPLNFKDTKACIKRRLQIILQYPGTMAAKFLSSLNTWKIPL